MTVTLIDTFVKKTLKVYKTVYVPKESSGQLRPRYTSIWDVLGTAEWFIINLLLTILKEVIKLQKIDCFSLNKLRLIRWTRTIDQSKTDIRALRYIHIAQEILLILYRQPSTYRRFDSAYRCRPFFSLHHLEYIYEEV